MTQPVLWYFADPMCSWCWGFAPAMDAIKQNFGDRMQVSLTLGGLRPGMREPLTDSAREDILHHWREVHKMTGQPFLFDGALPEGFVYDTEPACRAVVSLAELRPETTLPYFKRLQQAFYAEQVDVTQTDVLLNFALAFDVNDTRFIELFHSDDMREKTLKHFQKTRAFSVRGFPTCILQTDKGYIMLSSGYRPFDELKPEIEALLAP